MECSLTVKSQLETGKDESSRSVLWVIVHTYFTLGVLVLLFGVVWQTLSSRHLLVFCTMATKDHFMVLPGLYFLIIFDDLWMCITKNSDGIFSSIPFLMLVKFHAMVRHPCKPESLMFSY